MRSNSQGLVMAWMKGDEKDGIHSDSQVSRLGDYFREHTNEFGVGEVVSFIVDVLKLRFLRNPAGGASQLFRTEL